MSTRRTAKPDTRGQDQLPTGPNGRNICRCGCGREVPPNRQTFFGQECVDRYLVLRDTGHVRALLLKRDHGICAGCGIDCVAVEEAIRYFNRLYRSRLYSQFREDNDLPLCRTYWEAHHKLAVVEGGGECGLDDCRTQCVRCHKAQTRNLHRRLKRKRTGQAALLLEVTP